MPKAWKDVPLRDPLQQKSHRTIQPTQDNDKLNDTWHYQGPLAKQCNGFKHQGKSNGPKYERHDVVHCSWAEGENKGNGDVGHKPCHCTLAGRELCRGGGQELTGIPRGQCYVLQGGISSWNDACGSVATPQSREGEKGCASEVVVLPEGKKSCQELDKASNQDEVDTWETQQDIRREASHRKTKHLGTSRHRSHKWHLCQALWPLSFPQLPSWWQISVPSLVVQPRSPPVCSAGGVGPVWFGSMEAGEWHVKGSDQTAGRGVPNEPCHPPARTSSAPCGPRPVCAVAKFCRQRRKALTTFARSPSTAGSL